MRRALLIACASLVAAVFSWRHGEAQGQPFDLLIRNGLVVDGTGAPGRAASVGVRNGRIVEVGALNGATAARTLDATGLVVAPGFIDVHTHVDEIATQPAIPHFVRMGVTTVIAGNCGGSAADLESALREIETARPAINYATLVGHNTVRREVMGTANRQATPDELKKMEALVDRAMADGAVGFSTGLQYVPGTYAETAEIVALARVSARRGGVYATHMRNEGTALEEAVGEAINVAEQAQCPLEISHLKVDAPSRWGASAKALAMIDAARARGLRVNADQYLYDAASSNLGIRFPSWVLEGGQEAINARLDDPATWEKVRAEMRELIRERGLEDYDFARIAEYRTDRSLNGLTIPQAAQKVLGAADLATQQEMMRRMLRAGGASMVYHFMSDDDLARILRHPMVSIASDSGLNTFGEGVPHPRGYGNAVRVLGKYVREQKIITLEEAVRKMTSLPADQFGFADRGRLAPDKAADIVIFDAGTVADTATYSQPHQYATGIVHVLVNGMPVVERGTQTDARPGRVLRHKNRL
ncbi:MAG TPA: D-aminoacylase [Vicinamibacterales bacterium]|nr:D-aminoacylase [Vicinamibacterales bacterium]